MRPPRIWEREQRAHTDSGVRPPNVRFCVLAVGVLQFRAQRTLALAEVDATLGFGEYLGRESYAECIQLSGRRIDLGLLRHAGVVDLGGEEGVELTVGLASVIAPLLRANRRLRWLRLNPGASWIDVAVIRRGGKVCWRSICKGAAADMHDAECVCVAGLLEPCPPPGYTVRPKSGDGAPDGGAKAARRQCHICFEMEARASRLRSRH